jgi:hypothetical protein
MMKRIPLFLLTLFMAAGALSARPSFPDNGQLFVDTVVPRVDIKVDPDTLEWIYANP